MNTEARRARRMPFGRDARGGRQALGRLLLESLPSVPPVHLAGMALRLWSEFVKRYAFGSGGARYVRWGRDDSPGRRRGGPTLTRSRSPRGALQPASLYSVPSRLALGTREGAYPIGTPPRCWCGARRDVSGRGVSRYAPTPRMGSGGWPPASPGSRPRGGCRRTLPDGRGSLVAGGWLPHVRARGTKDGVRGTALGRGALRRVMTDPPRIAGSGLVCA